MGILGLDHISLCTTQVDCLVAWYEQILGLRSGPRPPFESEGAWLYAGETAIVHILNTSPPPTTHRTDLSLEHGAFRATGFDAFIATLKAADQRYEISKVPKYPVVQVNVWDPDGNHLHVDFEAAECGALGR